jgi:serine protease
VDRSLSGRAHLLKLQKPIALSEARAIAARLRASGEIESAEPDQLMRIDSITPTDPGYAAAPGQWHYMTPTGANLGGADLPDAWEMTLGSTSIDVAVLDTGYRPHADFAAMLPGYDFITAKRNANDGNKRDSNASDPGDWVAAGECGSGSAAASSSWHGTHVMGTIAALMNNGLSGTGIAPNVRLLPVRVLGKCGGYTSDIVDAMRWAAGIDVPGAPHNSHPARILNLSFGSSGVCSSAFQSAVNDVNAVGAIVVAASGNGGFDSVNQPANCAGGIAVTAHAKDGDNADYANIGTQVTISAPGGGCGTLASACQPGYGGNGPAVYSLGNSGLTVPQADNAALKRGTSMAAPHVTGTIALMLSLDPTLSRAQVMSILRASARPHPPASACALDLNAGLCGAGLLDAQAALKAIVPAVQISASSLVVAPAANVNLAAVALAPTGRSIVSYQWLAAESNPSVIPLTNAETASVSFSAPLTGTYLFTLKVTDSSGATGTATATVRVNSAPVLLAPAPHQLEAGTSLRLQLSATDADENVTVFHASALPAGASLSAAGLFNWPSATPVGNYAIVYSASDNDSSSAPGVLAVTVTPGSNTTATAAPGSGGGGSMDMDFLMLGAAAYAGCRRLRRKTS